MRQTLVPLLTLAVLFGILFTLSGCGREYRIPITKIIVTLHGKGLPPPTATPSGTPFPVLTDPGYIAPTATPTATPVPTATPTPSPE